MSTTDSKHVLILGLNYAPEEVGIARYTAGMARGLAERGWSVTVVAGQPYYPQWCRYTGYRNIWSRAVENGVTVVRCPHYIPRRPGGMKRLAHLASFAVSALFPLIQAALNPKRRPDIVICVAPALLSVPTAWLASRLSGRALWIHVQDLEVEAALAMRVIEPAGFGRILGAAAMAVEGVLFRAADHVSTISARMAERLAAKGVAPHKIVELRNWADNSIRPDPARGSSYRAEWGLGAKKVALYSGSISNKQGIELLVRAARDLEPRQDLVMVICGEGAGREALEQAAAASCNLVIKDLQPSGRMCEMLALADVHLLPQLADAADLVLPSKLANMLASGRPVVATAQPATGIFDELQGCGICTPPGDPHALARAIIELIDEPDRAAELGAQGRARAIERWSASGILDELDVALTQLLPAHKLALIGS